MKNSIKLLLIAICLFAVFFSACSKMIPNDEEKKPSDTDSITENIENTDNTENTESDSETNNETIGDVGGTQFCPVHYYGYHSFYGKLIDPLGDEFYEWINSKKIATDNDNECDYPEGNIKTFIDRFNIPREEFEEVCSKAFDCVYDIDLLYSDDIDAIEAYFRDVESREKTVTKQAIFNRAKGLLLYDHSIDNVNESLVSMCEVAEICNCSREEIENTLQKAKEMSSSKIAYDYNFDVLFDTDGNLKPYDKNKSRVELDEMFCGVDNWYTD